MIILSDKLINAIRDYNSVVFYGTGYVSQKISEELSKKYNFRPDYYVISGSEQVKPQSMGKGFFFFEEKIDTILKNESLVFVAVSDEYVKEILDRVLAVGVTHVLTATDYCIMPLSPGRFLEMYEEETRTALKKRITNYEDFFNSLIENARMNCPLGDVDINIVVCNFSPRIVKITNAIICAGKRVRVYLSSVMRTSIWRKYEKALADSGVDMVYFDVQEQLLCYLSKSKGIIHIFSNGWDPYVPYLLVSHKNRFKAVVFENYDILNGYYVDIDTRLLAIERELLENADGVTYRLMDLDYLKNNVGIRFPNYTLRFLDWCGDCFIPTKKNNKSLSLCYVGGVTKKDPNNNNPLCQWDSLAEMCRQNNCTLHVYPSDSRSCFDEYCELEKNNPNFVFHEVLNYDELIDEISQYDYGVFPVSDDIWEQDVLGYNKGQMVIDATNNKYFDYIDAGLPIITIFPQKLCAYLAERGVLIPWTLKNYDFDYLRSNLSSFRESIIKHRDELRVSSHIMELLGFYDKVIRNSGRS